MRKVQPKSYQYIESLLVPESDEMRQARENAQKLGLEAISLPSPEAALVQFHLRSIEIKKMVEIGTLTGLSALYWREAMGDNSDLWTLEKSPEHVRMAQELFEKCKVGPRVHVVEGDARVTLQALATQAPFDAVFIDGNKAAYLDYFKWAIEHTRLGGVIVADNVFLSGAVWGESTSQKFNEKQITAVREMNRLAFDREKFQSVLIPTEEGLLICKKIK